MSLFVYIIDSNNNEQIGSNTCNLEEVELILKTDQIEMDCIEYNVVRRVYSLHPDVALKIYVTDKNKVELKGEYSTS